MTSESESIATALRSLSERQRYCLRQVGMGRQSKHIANKLGLSPYTIDKDLERATRTLACINRFAAAELLREHERPGYEPFVYESGRLAAHLVDPPDEGTSPTAPPGDEMAKQVLREVPVRFEHRHEGPMSLEARWSRLGPLKQSLMILLAIVILSLLVGGTVAAWLGIDWLIRQHGIS